MPAAQLDGPARQRRTLRMASLAALSSLRTPAYGLSRLYFTPFHPENRTEVELRAPIVWLKQVNPPIHVLEGARAPGNSRSLLALQPSARNAPNVHFRLVQEVA